MPVDISSFLNEQQQLAKGQLLRGQSIRDIHGHDESHHAACAPDAVFIPTDVSAAASMVEACSMAGIPIVPYGVGSGQEGGTIATQGGISIDTSSLNRILEVNVDDMDCLVEAGVTRLQLEAELRASGLFFPVDPGADASLGGMAATGASGTTAPLYGSMLQNVMGLEVILADGRVIETGCRAAKSSSGYNLTQLFVGSEGTLGLITKIRLKLHPQPSTRIVLSACFDDLADAVNAVSMMRAYGMALARAELMNATLMRGVELMTGEARPRQHLLCVEFHANDDNARQMAQQAEEILSQFAANEIEVAAGQEEQSSIWRVRHHAAEAEKRLRPGARAIVTDVCVPVSCLADIIARAEHELAQAQLLAPLCCHLGDGNFHYALLVDPNCQEELDWASAFKTWLAKLALDLGGTISGEHGIGLGKRHLMQSAHGGALAPMRAIKAALDPHNIFNPGKVFPSDDEII